MTEPTRSPRTEAGRALLDQEGVLPLFIGALRQEGDRDVLRDFVLAIEDEAASPDAELRRLSEAATPGPWQSTELPPRDHEPADVFGRSYIAAEGSGYPGADLSGRRAVADAALIVAAVNDLRRRLSGETEPS